MDIPNTFSLWPIPTVWLTFHSVLRNLRTVKVRSEGLNLDQLYAKQIPRALYYFSSPCLTHFFKSLMWKNSVKIL